MRRYSERGQLVEVPHLDTPSWNGNCANRGLPGVSKSGLLPHASPFYLNDWVGIYQLVSVAGQKQLSNLREHIEIFITGTLILDSQLTHPCIQESELVALRERSSWYCNTRSHTRSRALSLVPWICDQMTPEEAGDRVFFDSALTTFQQEPEER